MSKLRRMKKGTLVKWTKMDETSRWISPDRLLKTGDLGIVLGKVQSRWGREVEVKVHWQRLGMARAMNPKDIQISKNKKRK